MFDQIDKTLISELQADGRKPLLQIAKKTGISHVAVKKRLSNLLKKGLIEVSAHLNLSTVGAKIATITVEVENYDRMKELIQLFKDCPRTVFLTSLTASQLLSIVVGEDLSTLENVVGVCSIRAQKGIRRSEVHVGNLPNYPKFLPIRVYSTNKGDIAPCKARCDTCNSFINHDCLGCPATSSYHGPL